MVGGLSAAPAEARMPPTKAAASLHKAKPLKALPALKVGAKPAATPRMASPYARAAAQRNDSGRVRPGHPYAPPVHAANPTGLLAP
jgi:hypothetical protein